MLRRLKWFRWGLADLLTVPMVRVRLETLPVGSLQDGNIGAESSTHTELTRLQAGLQRTLLTKHPAIRDSLGGPEYVPVGAESVEEVAPTEHGGLRISVSGKYLISQHGASEPVGYEVPLALTTEDSAKILDPKDLRPVAVGFPVRLEADTTSSILGLAAPPIVLILPRTAPDSSSPDGKQGLWFVPTSVANLLDEYRAASEDDPYYAPGRTVRMLYLSATTITTLGLGDISPISSAARLLVGFEALLGIVFIGLFLNDMGRRASARRSIAKATATAKPSSR